MTTAARMAVRTGEGRFDRQAIAASSLTDSELVARPDLARTGYGCV
jgi:hypothetical protein